MEEELMQINEIKERLEALEKFVEAIRTKVDSIDEVMYDEILNPLSEHIQEYEYNGKLNEFKDKYFDRLDPYSEKVKSIEGEDFDIYKQVYDDYASLEEEGKPSEDEYIDLLTKQLDEQLDKIRKSLGLSEDAPLTIEDNGQEEAVITVEEDPAAAEAKQDEAETAAEEEVSATDATEEKQVDEVAEYEKELEAWLPKKQAK